MSDHKQDAIESLTITVREQYLEIERLLMLGKIQANRLNEALAVIEHLQSELKGSVPLKYHDDLMHEWKVSEVAKDKRIRQLEADREHWYCELCGCESCIKAEALANSGVL